MKGKKPNIVISTYAEKAFEKIQHPFTINKKIEGNYLNVVKATCEKSITLYSMVKD